MIIRLVIGILIGMLLGNIAKLSIHPLMLVGLSYAIGAIHMKILSKMEYKDGTKRV